MKSLVVRWHVLPVALVLCTLSICALSASGSNPSVPAQEGSKSAQAPGTVAIPGPLRSFLRMAGISQKASAEEVAPLLARNVFLLGYEGRTRPTEFLVLLVRYVQQARELAVLAGPQGVIQVSNCDEARPLLAILGYRTRPDCGTSGTYLETADSQRAFLTIDSGFPLPELEKSLQGSGAPFKYAFPITRIPVLFAENDWTGGNRDFVDTILRDPVLARLYWAMGHIDPETRNALRQAPGLRALAPYGPVLSFYGGYLRVRSGHVMVPGGAKAKSAWADVVGASPDSPGDFVLHLVSKDNGWLANYFDAISRSSQVQQARFTESTRLRRYYEALRGHNTSPGAANSVYRPAPGLLLLLTRLQWEANDQPHVPGNLEVWKRALRQKSDSAVVSDWGKRARHIENSGQLLEAMFALSRVETDTGPLQSYLMLSELDARRTSEHHLSPETVSLMTSKFYDFSNQYLVFSEFPNLNDASITSFIDVAEGLNGIQNHSLRGNALGTFQSVVGMWQILARQGEIPTAELNRSWQAVLKPFSKMSSSTQLFDAGASSVNELVQAATGKPTASQEELIDLLAGPRPQSPEAERVHQEVATRIRSVIEEQRLVSLDTILALGEGLHGVSKVKASSDALLSMAGELREFEMPQPIFTNGEREKWATGIYSNHHTETQMRTDLTKVIKSPSSPGQLAEARGQLAPFLRDTLVGFNYAYYEPPGSQMLHHNPLFVRSHDFAGDTVVGVKRVWQAPQLFGAGSPAGGGARLVGSLADLPYVLAEAEQDFITPESVQALIWGEVVPGLLTSAVVPRWWNVTPNELHAVRLYQQAGEELLTASAGNEELRGKVMSIFNDRMLPQTAERVADALHAGQASEIASQLMPADTFYLTAEFRHRYPDQSASFGTAGKELEDISQRYPAEVGWERLSRDFGVPHPVLAHSYATELLNLAPFPAFMGDSNRFFAESWDSNNLYWARLADEKGYAPATLNLLVPQLTHRMVEKIFATDLEDWPALLRATRETGDEFRQGRIPSGATTLAANAASDGH